MYRQSNPEVPFIDKGVKFQNFCQETSLHGWKFLYFKKFEACQAAIWTLAISTAISICGWLISTLVLGKLILGLPFRKVFVITNQCDCESTYLVLKYTY